MDANIEQQSQPIKVYTTEDGCTVIEQSADSMVVLSAEQILKVIKDLHVCYDYCAVWKQAPRD